MDKRERPVHELEDISERIRMGVPVGYEEALAAIVYQCGLQEVRDNRWWRKLFRTMSRTIRSCLKSIV
jgi:GH24 family phage-related lysozyme (muramidase)